MEGPGFHSKPAVDVGTVLNVLGARAYNVHSPLQPVLVWFEHAEAEQGLILGAIAHPEAFVQYRGILLSEGAGVGAGYDRVHRDPIGIDDEVDPDFPMPLYEANCGRPWDTLGGDWGVINELGVGVSVLKLNADLRAGYASVGVSYLDNLVRLTGDRISIESPSLEYDHFQDQGESSTIVRSTPYVWEGLGAVAPDADPAKSEDWPLSIESVGKEQLSKCDVQHWDQVGIFRWMELHGFLGGLRHEYAILPRDAATPVRRSQDHNWPGLYEQQVDVDGFVTIRTAKGMLIEKTSMIPVPEQKREPWDPKGDKDDGCDYGKEAYDTDKVDYDWGDTDPTSRAVRTADHNSFRTGEAGLRGLHDHNTAGTAKDWRIPHDPESAVVVGIPDISPLGQKFHADLPTPSEVDVDHRRKGVKYYPGRAFALFGDDGSITLQDAYGSSIVMTGGNIEVCPRADLILRPGRSVIGMAPHDVILNAGNSAELTASKGDVRVKAEKNLHALAGNSGTGGVLIESRAIDPQGTANSFDSQGEGTVSSGIVLKSGQAPIAQWGSEIFVQSKVGRVVIDGAGGTQDVYVLGKDVRLVGEQSASMASGVKPGESGGSPDDAGLVMVEPDRTTMISGSVLAELTGGTVRVLKKGGGSATMFIDGSLQASTSIACPTTSVDDFDVTVYNRPEIKSGIQQGSSQFVSAWNTMNGELYKKDGTYGNADFFRDFSFSFNNSTDYWTTQDFMLHSTFWQLKLSSTGGQVWDQPIVKFRGTRDTRPWPGQETWNSGGFGKIEGSDLNNYDVLIDAGKSTPREETKGKAPTAKPLKGNYIVDSQ